MIKYALKCAEGHAFESWFASADAYDNLKAAGHVSCAMCGSSDVEKAIMAPRVVKDGADSQRDPAQVKKALAEMRKTVEENATYVGGSFASEALAQHLGDMPERPIWGEAKPEEAKALVEDGVPVAPLPFVPTRKAN